MDPAPTAPDPTSPLLPHMVGVHRSQDRLEQNVLPQQVEIGPARPDAEGGLADEPPFPGLLHRRDNGEDTGLAFLALPSGIGSTRRNVFTCDAPLLYVLLPRMLLQRR